MNVIERARAMAEPVGGGRLSAADANLLAGESGLEIGRLLLELIPLAGAFAAVPQSGFEVGAVARGDSGAIYFGANLEIMGCPLNQTVHAEQATVVNAANHGETGLTMLAASAPPCGCCRQFLNELANASRLEILLAGRPPAPLTDFLPGAFGPGDLGVEGGLLGSARHPLQWVNPPPSGDEAAEAAFKAASAAYAPYTQAFAGAAITTRSGKVFAGPYLENAAFNPSLSPLQAALIAASLGGSPPGELAEAAVVQVEDSKIDHAAAARLVSEKLAPGVPVAMHLVRIE